MLYRSRETRIVGSPRALPSEAELQRALCMGCFKKKKKRGRVVGHGCWEKRRRKYLGAAQTGPDSLQSILQYGDRRGMLESVLREISAQGV